VTEKRYGIADIFDTVQGEGSRAGCRSVFIRLAGCNLWNGHESGRDAGKGACARWCDTDFLLKERLTAAEIVARVDALWPSPRPEAGTQGAADGRWVVITGGEPTLQLDDELMLALNFQGIRIAVETNGTINEPALRYAAHVCLSPKLGSDWTALDPLRVREVKIVLPGDTAEGWQPDHFRLFEARYAHAALFVQARDPAAMGLDVRSARDAFKRAVEACLVVVRRPSNRWRISVQGHKALELP
jgi:7-carboxy-7-deazaguanine synthase